MHILVDIRTTEPSEIVRQDYAIAWSELWMTYHPHDTITFLAYEGSPAPKNTTYIPKKWGIFGGKKIAHHKHGPDRILSFSKEDPISHTIPTLTHIFDNVDILYPRSESGFFGKKNRELSYKNRLRKSHHIIVPHLETGMELVEIYDISEDHASVIPYFIPTRTHAPFSHLHIYGIMPGYWIVEGTPGDEWYPFRLLQAYGKYIHDYQGTKRLVITGDLGNNLKHITECIRGLDLMEYVKIVGVLPGDNRNALYEYASGWISVGGYYGGGPHIAYALSYGLPTLVSEVAPLKDYGDMLIHPNHIDELPEKLLLFSKLHTGTEKYSHSPHAIMDVYGRVMAECTCK